MRQWLRLNKSVLKPHVNEFLKMDLSAREKRCLYLVTRGLSISSYKTLMGRYLPQTTVATR